ncbi:MAG TPA: hypothetical protein EYG85_08885 [Crocinitomix sp.]|nr:hypothetical protein [Crocinitomix sp.]
MKKISTIVVLITLFSCSQSNWTKQEQTEFIEGCKKEGGTKSYCKCYMENVMKQYPIKEDANHLDYEIKIKLSKDCN